MILGSCRVCIIENDRQTMAGSLGELHVALDDGLEHQFLEVALHLVVDLVGQSQTTVVHRQQEALDLELGIQLVARLRVASV